MSKQDVLVKRGALAETKVAPSPTEPLGEGEIRLRVDVFSLTANNVTYGAAGDFLKYWSFYPTQESGWGRVPVWGFATVIETRSDSAKVGERVYGYLPMSTTFRIKPSARAHGGFSDESTHRAGLAPIYNRYLLNTDDALYSRDTEALQVLFRPLFMTSFLIDDFLADNAFFGAKQVVFSSASAKTSYATAQLLKARGAVKVIGLTSTANIGFVKELDFYHDVVPYDAIGSLDGSILSAFVDVAGDSNVRAAVHERFRDNLKYSCGVGATHWDVKRSDAPLPGPQTQMFFAPALAQKRVADWGPAGFAQRTAAAWAAFLPTAARTTRIVEGTGLAEAARVFAELASGRSKPSDGHVIRL